MAAITGAQMRKIFVLARERGMDDDLLHAYAAAVTGRDSMKELSVTDAILLIDALEGRQKQPQGHATGKQQRYLESLMRELGWVDEDGAPDYGRLDGMCKKYCHLDSHKWMTRRDASHLIEAMKNMLKNCGQVC